MVDAVKDETKRKPVTIIIIDYEMPDLDGLQAIKEIKAFYNNQRAT